MVVSDRVEAPTHFIAANMDREQDEAWKYEMGDLVIEKFPLMM